MLYIFDVKNVHKKVLSFVSLRRFGNNPFNSHPTDEGVIPKTSRTNKTEHFFMNIFHIEGLHKVLHSVFIYYAVYITHNIL